MNIPPDRTGQMNASVVATMRQVGLAINNTFHQSVASAPATSGQCTSGLVELSVPSGGAFDYIVSMEDLTRGQRVANYSVDFQRRGSSTWETLVPPVWRNTSHVASGDSAAPHAAPAQRMLWGAPLRDRPDGNDPRDSHIGHKRIDVPVVTTSGAGAIDIARVRLNCIAALEEPVYIRAFSLHRRNVPWDE